MGNICSEYPRTGPNEEPERGVLKTARDCPNPSLGQTFQDTDPQACQQLYRLPK